MGALGPAYPDPGPVIWAPDVDRQRARIRADLDGLRARAESASSWLESSRHYSRLINRQGVVPVSARMNAGDLAFLAEAREQMLQFTELAGRLIDLHQPLDAGGITTDPSSPIRRCRSCMWRWPCPTFSILAEVVDRAAARLTARADRAVLTGTVLTGTVLTGPLLTGSGRVRVSRRPGRAGC